MKGFIAIILFMMLVLAGAKGEHASVTSAIDVASYTLTDDCNIKNNTFNEGAILPLNRDKGWADMEFSDAHTLAHRVSASAERLYRLSSIETSQFIKALLRRMAIRMASLANHSVCIKEYSNALMGGDACDHYIYGMRRILI